MSFLSSFTALEIIVLSILLFTIAFLIYIFIFRRKELVNYLLLLGVVIAMLSGAEVIFSRMPHAQLSDFVNFDKGHHHIACYPYAPGTMLPVRMKDPQTGKDLLCVSEDMELRKRGYDPSRPQKALLVGDSFTYGGGVPEDQTLAYFLHTAFPKFNFLNHGKSGTHVLDIKKILYETIEKNPDIKHVIYFYNINDILTYGEVVHGQKLINDLEMVRIHRMEKFYSPVGKILSKSALFRMLNQVSTLQKETRLTTKNYLDSYDPQINPQGVKETHEALIEMHRFMQTRGGQLVVVGYPLLHKTMDGKYPFAPIHAAMAEMAQKNGIAYIDAAPAFDSQKSLRPLQVHPVLDYHPNGRANQMVIEYLFRIKAFKDWLK